MVCGHWAGGGRAATQGGGGRGARQTTDSLAGYRSSLRSSISDVMERMESIKAEDIKLVRFLGSGTLKGQLSLITASVNGC